MPVTKLSELLEIDKDELTVKVRSGKYLPQPILGVEIPKGNGKTRLLGIPTVTDRLLQQAVLQVINARFEFEFSDSSFGFRPNKNLHQAVLKAQGYINEGFQYIVDIDLKTFFDEVDHCYLLQLLYRKIKCRETIRLIRKWLRAPIQIKGKLVKRRKGVPQGSPLTPCTHLLTLNLYGELLLIGENFKFAFFIKSSIFAINEKIAEFRIGRTDQPCICFIERIQTARGGEIINKKVWSIPDTGISLYSIGQGTQRKDDNTGKFGGIYCEITLQFNQSGKRVGRNSGSYHQQIDKTGAGRIFSEAGKWQKRSNNLRYPVFMTGYGSKSSHRPTISLYQRTRWLLTRRILLKLN
jgi:hypothetical protein